MMRSDLVSCAQREIDQYCSEIPPLRESGVKAKVYPSIKGGKDHLTLVVVGRKNFPYKNADSKALGEWAVPLSTFIFVQKQEEGLASEQHTDLLPFYNEIVFVYLDTKEIWGFAGNRVSSFMREQQKSDWSRPERIRLFKLLEKGYFKLGQSDLTPAIRKWIAFVSE